MGECLVRAGDKAESSDSGLEDPNGLATDKIDKNLDKLEGMVRRLVVLLRFGDYAGRIWNCVRLASPRTNHALSVSLATVSQRLQSGECETVEAVEASVNEPVKGGLNLSAETAKAAIILYADRNLVCHADTEGPGSLCKDPEALDKLLALVGDGSSAHLARLVNLWVPAGRWLQNERSKSPDESRSDDGK